jgi:hypothetical protein
MKPFITKSFVEPKGLDKLLKKIPPENFLVEVNNLLANNSLDEISAGQIQQLSDKYKLKDASKKFKNELMQMLKDFLTQHLGVRGDEYKDFSSVQKLQNILGISDIDFDKEYKPLAIETFKKQVVETLNRAKKYQDEETKEFKQLAMQLNLTTGEAEQVVNEVRKNIIEEFSAKMVADFRVSPEETEEFERLCKGLDVTIDRQSREQLEKLQLLWNIENGELPVYEPNIILQKKELCHYKAGVSLYEKRKVTEGVRYSGPTYRLRIAKGFSYRLGNISTQRVSKDVMTLIDSGTLYITNKRIIFNGSKGTKTIRYNQIIDLHPYSDGVEIVKETGKSPTFILDDSEGVVLSATITRIIQDSQV